MAGKSVGLQLHDIHRCPLIIPSVFCLLPFALPLTHIGTVIVPMGLLQSIEMSPENHMGTFMGKGQIPATGCCGHLCIHYNCAGIDLSFYDSGSVLIQDLSIAKVKKNSPTTPFSVKSPSITLRPIRLVSSSKSMGMSFPRDSGIQSNKILHAISS